MNPQIRSITAWLLLLLTLVPGCQPIQPFFFNSDGNILGEGDLSHYMDVATDIEFPNVHEPSLEEVQAARAPLTLANSENFEMWDVSLEEVTRITLSNSQVVRQLGGRITDGGSNIAGATPETLQQNAAGAVTTYDPALVETGSGTGTGSQLSGTGVEAALAEFDAQLDSSVTVQNNDRPQNFATIGAISTIFATEFQQDASNFTAGITKIAADGTTFDVRNNTLFDSNNNGSRATPSDWVTNVELGVSHPLLQGRGTQLNRIAGPQSAQQTAAGVVNQIDGVLISRIRHDITLTDFEAGVRNLMRDVEDAYWELFFAYQDLEARKIGRDSALETWRKVKALQRVGGQGGEANQEAQSRSQYFLFRSQVETALTNLYRVENNLRYMMGLTHSDGRLIRPSDDPTTAAVHFDWNMIHCESLTRRTEIRKQKWQVKRRELELIATKNNLLPRLDLGGRYRFLGAGDDLIRSDRLGVPPFGPGSNAFESLTTGDFQEWEVNLQFSMPIGFRRAMSGVRHHQLLLARERAVLQDLELEVSHQLGNSIRDVDLNFALTQSNFNRRVAAVDEVEAVEAVYTSGRVTLDLVLDAQRRRAEAESAYYRSLVDYNRAIMRVHYRKGSLLEYNGVYLAEGPWPGKANFDALSRARKRDAGTYINYGYTRPGIISRGSHPQFYDVQKSTSEPPLYYEGPVFEEVQPEESLEEIIPTPEADEKSAISIPVDTNLISTSPDDAAGPVRLPEFDSQQLKTISTAQPSLNPVRLTSHAQPTNSPVAQPIAENPYRQLDSMNGVSGLRDLPRQAATANPLRPQDFIRQLPTPVASSEHFDDTNMPYTPWENNN